MRASLITRLALAPRRPHARVAGLRATAGRRRRRTAGTYALLAATLAVRRRRRALAAQGRYGVPQVASTAPRPACPRRRHARAADIPHTYPVKRAAARARRATLRSGSASPCGAGTASTPLAGRRDDLPRPLHRPTPIPAPTRSSPTTADGKRRDHGPGRARGADAGTPLSRVTSADGRCEFTLYDNAEEPFIHMLDVNAERGVHRPAAAEGLGLPARRCASTAGRSRSATSPRSTRDAGRHAHRAGRRDEHPARGDRDRTRARAALAVAVVRRPARDRRGRARRPSAIAQDDDLRGSAAGEPL